MEGGGSLVSFVAGLTMDEQNTLDGLLKQLAAKRVRNRLRSAYMDGKHAPKQLPPTVPPYLRTLGMVLGWPAKAVEALARRARLEAFAIPGSDLAAFGLDVILDENDYVSESREAGLSSLEHSVAFLIATRGDTSAGDPEVLITRKTALEGTGEWSARARRLVSFLSIVERDKKTGDPSEFNLYLPRQVIVCAAGRVQDRVPSGLPWLPVEPLVYRKRDAKPFGSSRITRPIMALTDSAVRSILRSEGTADFYSIPGMALFGPDESFFEGNPTWRMLLNGMFAIPDNPDAPAGQERAELKQFTQASQQPHVDQLEVWAQLFAAEASIPVSSLGIGATQANPTSAESYLASREDLISEGEDTIAGWTTPHVRTLQNAWMIREGATSLPSELRKLTAVWRDPRHESKAAAADWFAKLAGAPPGIAETYRAPDGIAVDGATATRLRADRAASQARSTVAALLAEPEPAATPTEAPSNAAPPAS